MGLRQHRAGFSSRYAASPKPYSLKLLKQIKKYNNEIAGWKQLQIHFLQKKSMSEQMAQISFRLSTEICKNIEDYLFVNQLVTRAELEKLLTPDRATESKLTT